MKLLKADLLSNVVGTYDQTKTTIQGRVAQKTIDGANVLGPPLSKFIDVFTDTTGTPVGSLFASENNRLFVVTGFTSPTGTIALYDFNMTTGVHSIVGRINFSLPNTAATTHILRYIRVFNDAGNTGWKICFGTTGSVLINGGDFVINNIDKADFSNVSPPSIPFATGTDQKAVYFVQATGAIGVGQLQTAVAGAVLDIAASRLYSHNGIAATHQYYVRDLTASLTYVQQAATITVATPGVVTATAHGFSANDPVVFLSGTVPTGLSLNTVYFVRNPTANTFELSITSGGASIATTGSAGSAQVGRAFGTTSAGFLFKTGNLPALAGTLLLTDSEQKAVPVAAPLNGGTLNGNSCAFFATTTNLYLGLLSELTNGGTTWPSLTTSNILGTVNQITAPTTVNAGWSTDCDSAVYLTNTSKLIFKKVVNNLIEAIAGDLNNTYYEGFTFDTVELGLFTVINMTTNSGWLFIAGGTIGQRGVIAIDIKSDCLYGYSFMTTKVLDTPNSVLKTLASVEKLYESTGNVDLYYRTSGFGSISGGWLPIAIGDDLTAIAASDQIQFKICFRIHSEGSSTPAQVNELYLGLESNSENSDYWESSKDQSASGSPTRCAFRLKKAFATSVPTLYFRAYDLSNNLLQLDNTVTHVAKFEYSTNNGSSWIPMGTIPNTVGTLVRYTFTSPPGVEIRPGLKEA